MHPHGFHALSSVLQLLPLIALVLSGSLSCGDDPAAPEEPTETNVSVESSNRATATIGPAGGTVSTTSNAGIAYTLSVPPGALPRDVEIAITPVASIGNLPYSGGLEGAVRLQPAGLSFLAPAELTIEAVANPTGDQRLIGFTYQGDAQNIDETVAAQVGGEIRVLVSHFSGAGAAVAEPGELNTDACDNLTPDRTLEWIIVNCVENRDQFLALMRGRLASISLAIEDASDHDALVTSISEYSEWLGLVYWVQDNDTYGDLLSTLANDMVAVDNVVRSKLIARINDAKSRCTASNLEWLTEIFDYRALAQAAFAEAGIGELTDQYILSGLCATAVIDEVSLVDPLPLNQDRSLDIDFALEIDGTRVPAAFDVAVADLTYPENVVQSPLGFTSAQGRYTTVVRRVNAEGAVFDIQANLMLPLLGSIPGAQTSAPVPIAVSGNVLRGGNATITDYFPASVPPGVAEVLEVKVERLTPTGPVPITGAAVTFAVSGGTANPTQSVTNGAGVASTEITAATTASNVTINVSASLNGTNIASKSVSAFVEEDAPASFQLVSRTSAVGGLELVGDCSGVGDPGGFGTGPGPLAFDVQGNETCQASVGDGTPATKYRSIVTHHVSDTGLDTGIIVIETDGTLTARYTCTGDPACDSEYAESRTIHDVIIVFSIAQSVNFEFDGNHTESFAYNVQPEFTLTRIDSGSDEKMNWDGYNQSSWDGTLEPGTYRVLFHQTGEVYSRAGDLDPEATHTWDTELTLKLTQVPSATSAGSR